jgi:hypothetical protein
MAIHVVDRERGQDILNEGKTHNNGRKDKTDG